MKSLNNHRGSAVPLILPVIFCIFCLVAMLWQTASMTFKAKSVHTAMQNVALTAMTQNSVESYNSKREGYTGAFDKQGISFVDVTKDVNVTDLLVDALDLTPNGTIFSRLDDEGSVLYAISDVRLEITNTSPLDSTKPFTATLFANLHLPVKYPMIAERQITISLKTAATNHPKF